MGSVPTVRCTAKRCVHMGLVLMVIGIDWWTSGQNIPIGKVCVRINAEQIYTISPNIVREN